MRKYVHIYDEAVQPLCNAIIAQAIKDYTLDKETYAGMEAKAFIESDWFEMLSDGMDGRAIIARLDKKMKQFQGLCEQHVPSIWKDSKEAHECQFSCPFCSGKVKIIWNDRQNSKVCKTYSYQCEDCGVRQTYTFRGKFTKVEDRVNTCKECQWFKPGKTRQAICIHPKHETSTTPTAFCEDFMKRIYEE